MKAERLEDNLIGYHCNDCGGHWICSRDYHDWLAIKGEILQEKDEYDITLRSDDILKAKLCPECRRIMTKYKVGHGLPFKLDICANCNGFWLDKNEWDILKSKNLHDEINIIFTRSWQKDIREEENRKNMKQVIEKRIGKETFEKADQFKQWFDEQEEKDMILAYLRNW
ncbi:MAG: zf-TFIIB domain-containing protein [Moorea sp. SIO2B7]|nr:zf-TFIIB domain-containing protein [Moorena sp. SIO2B7]